MSGQATALSHEALNAALVLRFPDAVGPLIPAKDPFSVVRSERLLEVAGQLKSEPSLAFDFLEDLTATDHPKESLIRVVYHLYSYRHRHLCVLKVELPRGAPTVDSLTPLWNSANWMEREVLDLFGVTFRGHPDPRRVLTPEDWVGHPLRKDFVEAGGYHGISNVRDNPLDLYLQLDRQLKPGAAPVPGAKKGG